MNKAIVPTHAGDDSDGKIWGIEGMNIVFILAAILLGIGLALALSRQHPPAVSIGLGVVPLLLTALYVGLFRQGKPRAFDTDLLETLGSGAGWTPPASQPLNPLSRHARS